MADFVAQGQKARKDPLGPVTLNQAHANAERVDELVRREHFADGQHNALEVPWVLGHVSSGTTGYLFNTAYGGGTIARPATGECTISVQSGVIESVPVLGVATPAACILANVSDADIANRPYTITAQTISETSIKTRVRRFISTLGTPGNSWDSQAVEFDLAVHAKKQPISDSLLVAHQQKQRRDFLTEAASDWNALARNQGIIRKALMAEHTSAGAHNADRVAKATGWIRPIAGPSYSTLIAHGIKSVTRIGTGVVEVELPAALSSTNLAACFAEAQPASDTELVVVNGRLHSNTGTAKFRFYLYLYSQSENKWSRDDRPFFAVMFGRWA